MADPDLISCPTCGEPMASAAPRCPHCGARAPRRGRVIFLAVALVLVVLAVVVVRVGWSNQRSGADRYADCIASGKSAAECE